LSYPAELVGREYALNGRKVMISEAKVCDLCVVGAKVGDKFSAFPVERGTPGFDTPRRENYPGLRSIPLGDLKDVLPLLIEKLRAAKQKP